jgi:branched-chain amino acid transport system substrate-binding protein
MLRSLLVFSLLFPWRLFSEDFHVGGIAILSGIASQYGTHAQQGAILALEDLESKKDPHQPHLKISWEDETNGKAERALAAYNKFVHVDKIHILFGPTFQDSLFALQPLLERDKTFIITPATPRLGLSHVFSTWTEPRGEAQEIASRIYKSYKRVAVLSAQQSWEQLAAKEFIEAYTKLGGIITSHQEPLIDSTQLKSEVLKVKKASPEAFFISSYTLFSLYAKELRNIGYSIPLYTIEADTSLLKNADGAAEGVISIGPSVPQETDFAARYKKRFAVNPDIPSHQSYDAVMLLAQAIRAGNTTAESIERYLYSFKEYHGVSGTITNKNGSISVSTAYFIGRGDTLIKEGAN